MSPSKESILLAVVPRLAYAYIRGLRASMRLEWRGRDRLDALREEGGQVILAFWHSRLVMMPYVYPGGRITVLSSRHRDSEMLARVLVRLGLDLSKGSSTSGGAAGLRDILRKAREGFDVGFTPDGPRGPRRRVKPGVIAAARLTGLPILPVAFSASPAWRLRTWDRTLVPRPFGRGLYLYGEPMRVPRDAGEEEQQAWAERLGAELDRLTDSADREVGIGPEPPPERDAAS
jgi:lysophospholipid acyltransferase (LPLAT)-like uncharacterized protein